MEHYKWHRLSIGYYMPKININTHGRRIYSMDRHRVPKLPQVSWKCSQIVAIS